MTETQERILTQHPAGKRGVRIEQAKYDAMRRALLKAIPRRASGVAFADLKDLVQPQLHVDVFGPETSVTWYLVAVKQDLEARGLIEQVPKTRTQFVRRVTQRKTGAAR